MMKKLNRDEFSIAIRRGLGRARMHVAAYGLDGVDDLVLAACLENQAYDSQCEAGRAPWLYDMIKGAEQYEGISQAIVAALRSGDDDHFSLEQCCDLAGLMGRDGDRQAATALREAVLDQAMWADGDEFGWRAFVMLDGIPAAVQIARRFGQRMLDEPEAWVNGLEDFDRRDAVKWLAPKSDPASVLMQEARYDADRRTQALAAKYHCVG